MMSIIHMLNVADLAFIAAGLGVALLMIVVSARDNERRDEEKARGPAKAAHRPRT